MFERFTSRARAAVTSTQQIARGLGHQRIGSGHLLLGLVRMSGSTASGLLRERGISVEQVREAVLREVAEGGERPGRTA